MTSLTTHCHNGGNWWSKAQDSLPSISSQLFLAVTASLANRLSNVPRLAVDNGVPDYTHLALTHVDWLLSCGMRNENGTFNDGLSLSTCGPVGAVYSYNQGVILGALVELEQLTGNGTYLDIASTIASAGIAELTTKEGIFMETGSEKGMDATGAQFKGTFVRNLGYLNKALGGRKEFEDFLERNTESVWTEARDDQGRIGALWQGPAMSLSAASQGSGLDCLVAAAGLGNVKEEGGEDGGVVVVTRVVTVGVPAPTLMRYV
jgi:predicted alpha-1,6-mannanase (GH76 family)